MAFRKRSQSQSMFDATKIDLVGVVDDVVELHIVKDSNWSDTDDELRSFQEKLQTYVGYALDGQMQRDYPETESLPWAIIVDALGGSPGARAAELIEATKTPIAQYDGALELRVR